MSRPSTSKLRFEVAREFLVSRWKGSFRHILSIVCLCLIFSASLFAQEFTGHVSDASKAAIAQAKITVTNQKTAVSLTTVTTSSGDYTLPYLTPGLYTVTAEAVGFSQEKRTQITLQVGQTAKIDFVLKVGKVTETVTVVSDESLLDGAGDVGEVVENSRVSELPINAENPAMLADQSAGANWYGSREWIRPFDDVEAILSINGGGAANNELLLDGSSNEAAHGDAYNGTNSQIGYIPPVSAVGEFKIITNPYDAQFGRASGGVIDMTLKSGTNTVHGSAYEFARRGWLDANTWTNNYYGTPRTSQKRDQWGGELDGPVRIPRLYNGIDKTFFLLQYENYNSVDPGTAVGSVPQTSWLTGDFSKLTYYDASTASQQPEVLYDPLTLHTNSAGVLVRDAFPGNVIPTNRISPLAQKILSYYPAPNLPSQAGQNPWYNNYQAPTPLNDVYRNLLAKVDQNISTKDRFSLRWGYWERYEIQSSNGIPGAGAQGSFPHGERSNTFATDWVHTISPNLLFDFKATGIDRANFNGTGTTGFNQASLGIPSSLIAALGIFTNSLPSIGLDSLLGIGNTGSQLTIGDSLAMLPSLTYNKGKHTLHAGMDYRILQSSMRTSEGGMSFSTDRTWTQASYNTYDAASGNSVASFLLGTATSGSASINSVYFWSQHYYAPFVQDDWKVTPRLTLNLGVRYDLNAPPVERHNRADYAFDPTVTNPVNASVSQALLPNGPVMGGMQFVGVNGAPRAIYSATKTDFQPRVGFAYQLDPNTVLHGGFGVMYRNPNPGANLTGFSSSTPYVASNDGMKTPTENFGVPANNGNAAIAVNPFPTVIEPTGSSLGYLTSIGQGPWFINPHYRTPEFQTYSLGFERRFLKYDTLEMNYVGTRTYHNDSSDNINRESLSAIANCNILLGGNPATCNSATGAYVQNPFQGLSAFAGTGYYSAPTIQALNLTRPFSAFGDISEYQLNNGRTWYNSLQVTGMHKWRDSLTLHGTWTWSKLMDSGGYADDNYRVPSRNIDSNDMAHRVTASGVWYLPVGRGRTFLSNTNRIVDTALGGWEFGSIFMLETGHPWTLNGSTYLTGNAWVPRHSDPSIPYSIRGAKACAEQYNEQPDGTWALTPEANSANCGGNYNFVVAPQYAPNPDIIYTGIRLPGTWNVDANIQKNFAVYDRMHLQFRLDAFNVPNHPAWEQGYDNGPADTNFGAFVKYAVGQSNQQRQVQLALKLIW